MSHAPRAALVAALGAACLLSGGEASAAPATLPVVELLTVTVTPATALLVSGSTATGTLGATVVDARTGSLGYLVTVSSDGFDLVGPPATSSPTTHIPGSAATVAVAQATGGSPSSTAPVALSSLTPAFQLLYAGPVGLLARASSYQLSLSVSIPQAAGAGLYAGTVTQSVV
jgi:hypothetical protein